MVAILSRDRWVNIMASEIPQNLMMGINNSNSDSKACLLCEHMLK